MRLWSIHPRYLDTKGLLAVWREGLLAQKVLAGKTRGYKNHPQLERFKLQKNPLKAIGCYLNFICEEGKKRDFCLRFEKILYPGRKTRTIAVSRGQLDLEFRHLARKLKKRSPAAYLLLLAETRVRPHPLFKPMRGSVPERWEKSRAVDKSVEHSCKLRHKTG